MDARTFMGLTETHNPFRWTLPITPGVCTPGAFLFGGCGLGAAIAALEGTTGRPLIWATAQYLSYARPPEVLDLDVIVPVTGHQVTQARVVGHVADREVITVNAALGSRPMDLQGTWAVMPEVPPPDECAGPDLPLTDQRRLLVDRIDLRVASGRLLSELPGPGTPDGRSALWAKLPEVLDLSTAALGILGDYVPFGIGQALGLMAGGNSLDNTIRIAGQADTEWVLLDVRVHHVGNGFGHGDVHLWAQDGTLLATASQSTIVRMWRDLPGSPNEPTVTEIESVPGRTET